MCASSIPAVAPLFEGFAGVTLVSSGTSRIQASADETDATRSRYVRKLYRRDPADASLYHLVLDATVLSTHDCVAVIAAAAQASWTFDELAVDEHLSSGRASDDPG